MTVSGIELRLTALLPSTEAYLASRRMLENEAGRLRIEWVEQVGETLYARHRVIDVGATAGPRYLEDETDVLAFGEVEVIKPQAPHIHYISRIPFSESITICTHIGRYPKGDWHGRRISLPEEFVRYKDSIIIPGDHVSRNHAGIIREGNHFHLFDYGKNGTYVDGRLVGQRPKRLAHGHIIRIDEAEFLVDLEQKTFADITLKGDALTIDRLKVDRETKD